MRSGLAVRDPLHPVGLCAPRCYRRHASDSARSAWPESGTIKPPSGAGAAARGSPRLCSNRVPPAVCMG